MNGTDGDSLWATPPLPEVKVRNAVSKLERSPQLVVAATVGKKLPQQAEGSEEREIFEELVGEEGFGGKKGSESTIRQKTGHADLTVSVYELGSEKDESGASYFALGARVASKAKEKGHIKEACLIVSHEATDLQVQRAVEGLLLGNYQDLRWKSGKSPSACCEVIYVVTHAQIDVNHITAVCEGIIFTRQLVNAPANVLNPPALAECMRATAQCFGMDITVYNRADCEHRKMGLYLAVARGAKSEPQFIHLTYRPQGEVTKKLCLVGKGICFDSGGYNLKVGAESMIALMKFDMGGAATIFGAARTIAKLKIPNVEVHFISAACENLISGDAYRPGDVIAASNGKTVEVVNTDAEGRMTLADALVYADNLGADYIIDIATLTGSMIVGLGNEYAGIFTPEDKIAETIVRASKATGENVWRMPFISQYKELLESPIADIK